MCENEYVHKNVAIKIYTSPPYYFSISYHNSISLL